MRNVILLFFSTIMITGLGLSLGLEHAVLKPIPAFFSNIVNIAALS